MDPKFIVDLNVGKLAKWLRIMGYDALLFTDEDDGQMIKLALKQHRIILTRDTQVLLRKVITSGTVKAILIEGANPKLQLKNLVEKLKLSYNYKPFSICSQCNAPLIEKSKHEVQHQVPPHVFQTQDNYMECPNCHRIYWRGTHWEAMSKELQSFTKQKSVMTGVK